MVKFNTTKLRSLKYKTRGSVHASIFERQKVRAAPPIPPTLAQMVGDRIRDELFGPNAENIEVWFHQSGLKYDPDKTESEVIEELKSNFVKNVLAVGKYILFLDDERSPTTPHCFVADHCFVARTSEAAIEIVKRLGFPRSMRLDYYLGYEKFSTTFIEWLISTYESRLDEVPDFIWTNHSQHEDKAIVDKLLYQFYRRICNHQRD